MIARNEYAVGLGGIPKSVVAFEWSRDQMMRFEPASQLTGGAKLDRLSLRLKPQLVLSGFIFPDE